MSCPFFCLSILQPVIIGRSPVNRMGWDYFGFGFYRLTNRFPEPRINYIWLEKELKTSIIKELRSNFDREFLETSIALFDSVLLDFYGRFTEGLIFGEGGWTYMNRWVAPRPSSHDPLHSRKPKFDPSFYTSIIYRHIVYCSNLVHYSHKHKLQNPFINRKVYLNNKPNIGPFPW